MKGNAYWFSRSEGGPRPALAYLLPSELAQFRQMRESGQITIFHIARCETCKREIPRVEETPVIGDKVPVLKWCSKLCFDQRPQ